MNEVVGTTRSGILPSGIAAVQRDDAWEQAVWREELRTLAEREQHSLMPNALGIVACIALAVAFPRPSAFFLPISLRLLTMTTTRIAGNRLRRRLDRGTANRRDLGPICLSLTCSGISWGSLAWPLASLDHLTTPAMGILIILVAGVCLITSMLGSMPLVMTAFLAAASLSAGSALLQVKGALSPEVVIALAMLMFACVGFSISTARQQKSAAAMLVDNQRLGEDLASALAHADFLSRHDPLTGLLNRRAFFEDRAERQSPRHLVAVDLDHFKAINDRFGHAMGDRVLIATADVLRGALRDLPGTQHQAVRLGGEEFLIELELEGHAAALSFAEALRHRLRLISETIAEPGLQVSASLGVASLQPGEDLDEAIRRADDALYMAKRQGRDRVMAAAA